MSDHLPECPKNWSVPGDCACELLRACEQRVLESAEQYIKAHMEGKRVGFSLGVQAARDAVEALPTSVTYMGDFAIVKHVDKEVALAAIDGLRGES